MALVMLMAAIHWTVVRRSAIPLDPFCMPPVLSLKRGLNQMSAPYVNLGITTLWYNWCMSLVGMPMDDLDKQRISRTYSVPFATAYAACSF